MLLAFVQLQNVDYLSLFCGSLIASARILFLCYSTNVERAKTKNYVSCGEVKKSAVI